MSAITEEAVAIPELTIDEKIDLLRDLSVVVIQAVDTLGLALRDAEARIAVLELVQDTLVTPEDLVGAVLGEILSTEGDANSIEDIFGPLGTEVLGA